MHTSPTWYRPLTRVCGLAASLFVVALAAQWLSLSFGWDPLVSIETVRRRSDDIAGPLREGPAMLVAVALGVVALGALVGWLLSLRHPNRDATFRVGARADRLRIDRDSLAASLERRLAPLDRRVDADVTVTRRGRVDVRLVTPDVSATGPIAEHTEFLADVLTERGLPCRVGNVDVVDVRRLKDRHRIR